MIIAPVLGQALSAVDSRWTTPVRMDFPAGSAGWSNRVPAPDPEWRPQFPGADLVEQVTYRDGAGNSVTAVAILYRLQAQGAELIGDRNSLLGDAGTAVSDEIVTTPAGQFRELIGEDRYRRRFLIRYRYDVGGQQFVHPLMSQLGYGVRSLVGAPFSSLLAYGAACVESCEDARNLTDRFLEQMARSVETSLPRPAR